MAAPQNAILLSGSTVRVLRRFRVGVVCALYLVYVCDKVTGFECASCSARIVSAVSEG